MTHWSCASGRLPTHFFFDHFISKKLLLTLCTIPIDCYPVLKIPINVIFISFKCIIYWGKSASTKEGQSNWLHLDAPWLCAFYVCVLKYICLAYCTFYNTHSHILTCKNSYPRFYTSMLNQLYKYCHRAWLADYLSVSMYGCFLRCLYFYPFLYLCVSIHLPLWEHIPYNYAGRLEDIFDTKKSIDL